MTLDITAGITEPFSLKAVPNQDSFGIVIGKSIEKQTDWAKLPSLLCHHPERDAIAGLKFLHLFPLKIPRRQSLKRTLKHAEKR
jgi:hypothetical protein